MWIAESRYRPRPVVPVQIRAALFAPNLLPISDEPRTLHAANDFAIEDHERGGHMRIVAGGWRPRTAPSRTDARHLLCRRNLPPRLQANSPAWRTSVVEIDWPDCTTCDVQGVAVGS